jgi:hypothetical protein
MPKTESETNVPVDVADYKKRHRPETTLVRRLEMCAFCVEPWPCDAIVLCDEVESLRKELKQWHESFDGYPRLADGIAGNEFISVHNRAMMEYRKTIARLTEALEKIKVQKLSEEFDAEEQEYADYQGGYDEIVKIARAALKVD